MSATQDLITIKVNLFPIGAVQTSVTGHCRTMFYAEAADDKSQFFLIKFYNYFTKC